MIIVGMGRIVDILFILLLLLWFLLKNTPKFITKLFNVENQMRINNVFTHTHTLTERDIDVKTTTTEELNLNNLPLHCDQCIFTAKNWSIIQTSYIDCFRWPVAHHNIEFNMLTLGQWARDTALILPSNGFTMNEHILLCIITLYEAIAFLDTIEFNHSGNSAAVVVIIRFCRGLSIRAINQFWHGLLCCFFSSHFSFTHSLAPSVIMRV